MITEDPRPMQSSTCPPTAAHRYESAAGGWFIGPAYLHEAHLSSIAFECIDPAGLHPDIALPRVQVKS
ncbi:hypothetical protein [Pendulispora albinea]|uniref:Uncharacterized protein n=1 Tax=Pendulispora albinea TaxID=2741071 RepID=A0ABZ2M407_9BACT